jgi:hypothetical protein
VLGYRILRSASADGPFDLMGESSVPGFTGVPLPHDTQFCYVMESYNANMVSARSAALCAMVTEEPDPDPDPDPDTGPDTGPDTIYLPRLGRP